jgi:hypothetical protein
MPLACFQVSALKKRRSHGTAISCMESSKRCKTLFWPQIIPIFSLKLETNRESVLLRTRTTIIIDIQLQYIYKMTADLYVGVNDDDYELNCFVKGVKTIKIIVNFYLNATEGDLNRQLHMLANE